MNRLADEEVGEPIAMVQQSHFHHLKVAYCFAKPPSGNCHGINAEMCGSSLPAAK
jgi:hypothetical protein